jgi:ABC-type multidrug transport system ATPase subunit
MLDLHDVSHVYANGTRALDHVTLSIPRGMYGLLGPNGAGKSTLMRTIATLQTPTEGSIRFGDIDVIAEPERLRRTLGYLPQDFGVYPRVSAYDMLDHMAVLKGIATTADRKRTVETLLNQGQPLGRPQEGAGGLFGRDASALRNCPGADRQSRN